MSFRGNLLRSGIDSDGKVVTVYRNDGRLDIATASSKATGTIRSANFTHTHTALTAGINEVFRACLTTEYRTGTWANAIVGRIDYGTTGDSAGGMAAAICGEINLPAKDMHNLGGGYYCFDAEIEIPDNCVLMDTVGTRPVAFINFGLWGTDKGEFDEKGFLFRTDGLTAEASGLLSENARTLRVNIEGTSKYLYLSDTEDDLGAAVFDTMVLDPGRIATSSLAGAAVSLDSDYTYGSGIYLRYNITDWTGIGSEFTAAFIRAEATTVTAANKDVYGATIYGTTQVTMTSGQLNGALIYAFKKGSADVNIDKMYAVQAELTWEADGGTTTIQTEAAIILAKVTGGTLDTYTQLHGQIFRFGDMNAGSRTYGNGILMEDDAGMGGTATLTTGLNIAIGCTTGITITAATTGISLGNCPTGVDMTDVGAEGENFLHMVDGYCGNIIETGHWGEAAGVGVKLTATNRHPAVFMFDDGGVALESASYRPFTSKVWLSTSPEVDGFAIRSLLGMLGLADGVDLTITAQHWSTIGAVEGYLAFAGTHALSFARAAAVSARLCGSPILTLTNASMVCGFFAENATVTSVASITDPFPVAFCADSLSDSHTTTQTPWKVGLYLPSGGCTTGIQIGDTALRAIYISGAILATTGRGIHAAITQATANHGDGYAANELDLTISGTSGGHVACMSSWVNATSGTHGTGGAYINAASLGVYFSSGATISAARVNFGFRASYQGGQTPSALHLISYSSPGVDITSMFHIGQFHANVGVVASGGDSGGSSAYVKFMSDDGGNVKYVRLYDGTT